MPALWTLTLHPVQLLVYGARIVSRHTDDILKHPAALSQYGHLKPVSEFTGGLHLHIPEFG